uniref:ABC transporter permease n=1 Tax=Roseihalotalea indica TaxID=2867963 RepID=A0AA49JH74_9BACT|nr:ABC transporter permease [Tunicatimonas sp. TK19036]
MLRNYLKIASRYLAKYRVFTFINVVGLGVGMACCLFIFLFVRDELSYDQFYPNKDRLYRVVYHATNGFSYAQVPPPIAPLMPDFFPEVETAARAYNRGISVQVPDAQGEHKNFEEDQAFFVDSTFLDIFSLNFIAGNAQTRLADPNEVVLNREMAEKYFGAEAVQQGNVIGKTLLLDGNHPYKVVAIAEDFPDNAHLHFSLLVPYESMFTLAPTERDTVMRKNLGQNWVISHSHTYVRLREGTQASQVDNRFGSLLTQHAPEQLNIGQSFTLQPITDIHLNPDVQLSPEGTNDRRYVYIFSAIALLTLLIACFNFINIATAQSVRRVKEVGMRKVMGARKIHLFGQFMSESMWVSFLGFLLALFIIFTSLPEFNNLTQKNFTWQELLEWPVVLTFIGVFVLTGLLGGSYPAVYLSRWQVMRALRNAVSTVRPGRRWSLRHVLVVLQFTASIALISGTVIIFRQLHYLENQPVGFDREAIVTVPLFSQDLNNIFGGVDGALRSRLNTFENELTSHPGIEASALSSTVLGIAVVSRRVEPEGVETEGHLFAPSFSVDYDFLETYGLELVAGRGFNLEAGTDHTEAFIVNESAVQEFNWGSPEEALGKEIELEGKVGKVIGVVRDFHYTSLYLPIGAMVMDVEVPMFTTLSIRLQGQQFQEAIAYAEAKWQEYFPGKTFEYSFLDESLREMYENDARIGQIIGIFALLAILVSCLGSYGLAMLLARQKEKEIGIRKVLGASLIQIITILTRNYFLLILIASVLAIPLAYWAMNEWLTNFAYRIPLSAGLFMLAIIAVLLIAALTISHQTIKAAFINPADTLKDE